MSEKYHLTPVELELMEILWKKGEGTVRAVLALLPKTRELAYTTVSTILRILEQKEVLSTKKLGKTHIYKPSFNKEAYARHSVKRMVKQVFSDNPVEMVAHLVDKKKLSLTEIEEIQKLLDAKKRELAK